MKRKNILQGLLLLIGVFFYSSRAYAMHIAEGFLPIKWAGMWGIIVLPFLILGIRRIRELVNDKGIEIKVLLAVAGAFVFVLSSLKLPSITGSCSHPTGIGLGAILFGPGPMVVLGTIVLIFQALLLAHGGLTTLGANVFSMAIVGAFVAYGLYSLAKKLGLPIWAAVFLGAAIGNLMTYTITATQLSLAFPGQSGFLNSLLKFMSVFSITQIPLAITEGLLTVLVFNFLRAYSKDELRELSIIGR
ncbi:MAG: energy-coupling factor ABC transporter permease [Bacillota bacterium]